MLYNKIRYEDEEKFKTLSLINTVHNGFSTDSICMEHRHRKGTVPPTTIGKDACSTRVVHLAKQYGLCIW